MTETVGIICVHYSPERVLRTLRILYKLNFSIPICQNVLVANQQSVLKEIQTCQITFDNVSVAIRHDNSAMEFGGYQAGLDHLLRNGDPDWVLFANDTFAIHQNFGTVYQRKLAASLHLNLGLPAVIGQVVSLPRSYQMAGMRTNRWITTNLFAINRAGLKVLGSRIYRSEIESLVNETSDMAKFFSGNMDPVLREHLEAWLFRAHPGWHWYASEPLQPANVDKMVNKARSILQEKYLSALLENVSATFVDLNDLSVSQKIMRQLERKIFSLSKRRM